MSRCQPVTIATDQYAAGPIVANAVGVYWGMAPNKQTYNMSVVMYPTAGGPLITLAAGVNDLVRRMAVDAKNVYWQHGQNITQVPVGGGGLTPVVVSANPVGALAVDGTSVFWQEIATSLNKTPVGGGPTVKLVTTTFETYIEFVTNSTSLFCVSSQANDLLKVSKTDGAITILVPGYDSGPIVADENNVYWVGAAGMHVNAVPVGGGSITVLGTMPYKPGAIAQDEANLYISSYDANGAILKIAKTGGDAQVIASGHGYVPSLAVDATSVYWAGSDSMVLKVAK